MKYLSVVYRCTTSTISSKGCKCLTDIFDGYGFFPLLSQVKVVIIDSITFHFRQDFDNMALRTRLLGGMALKLMKLANKFSLAVRIVVIFFTPTINILIQLD